MIHKIPIVIVLTYLYLCIIGWQRRQKRVCTTISIGIALEVNTATLAVILNRHRYIFAVHRRLRQQPPHDQPKQLTIFICCWIGKAAASSVSLLIHWSDAVNKHFNYCTQWEKWTALKGICLKFSLSIIWMSIIIRNCIVFTSIEHIELVIFFS